jgi:hypothetical protein
MRVMTNCPDMGTVQEKMTAEQNNYLAVVDNRRVRISSKERVAAGRR